MKKKLFCLFLVVAIVSFGLVGCGQKPAEQPAAGTPAAPRAEVITWKVQGFTPPGTLFQDWLDEFAHTVKDMSGGRLVIETYPPGSIVPSFEGLNAIRDGILDAHWGYPGMWIGQNIASPLFNSVPGGFLAQDALMWMFEGGGLELWNEMHSPYNAHVVPCGLIGMEIFMWSDKPFHTVEDMKGNQLRMMPLMGDILSENGLSVAFLPAAEIIPSLERKVLDAAEYSIPAFDITLGFQDVAKYFHYPGIHQPASFLELAINQDKWNALPDDLKRIVEYSAKLSIMHTWVSSEAENIRVLEQFEQMGLEQIVMNQEDVETMMRWADEWMEAKAKEDAFFNKVRQSQIDFSKWWYPYKDATSLPIPEWSLR